MFVSRRSRFGLWAVAAATAATLSLISDAAFARGPGGRPPGRHGPHAVRPPAHVVRHGPVTVVRPPVKIVRPGPVVVRPAPPSPALVAARALHYLLAPPVGHVVVRVGGVTYYRHGHVYYRPTWYDGRWVYVEVAPPVGVTVVNLPPSPDRVVINGQVYYRAGSTFYVESTDPPAPAAATPVTPPQPQYVVTRPPIGAVLDALPAGASALPSGGTTYFQAEGAYYLPIQAGEGTKYVVVNKPG